MPSKDRDRDTVDVEERPKEKRRSSKSERKGESEKDREHRHRHKSSRLSKTRSVVDSDVTTSSSHRRHRTKDDRPASPSTADAVPELNRSRDRVTVPYPSLNKAHSKENVYSREDLSTTPATRRTDPLTPEATDLSARDIKRSASADSPAGRKVSSSRKTARPDERPPSPPETNLSGSRERAGAGTPASIKSKLKEPLEERPRSRTSWLSRSASKSDDKSKVSATKSRSSSQATFVKSPAVRAPFTESARDGGSSVTGTKADPSSVATSVAPKRNVSSEATKPDSPDVDFSPGSAQDSSPRTPTLTAQFPSPMFASDKPNASQIYHEDSEVHLQTQIPAAHHPPPPPPLHIQEAPRVDYLLQNGGLPQPVSRSFLTVLPRQNGTRPSNPPLQGAQTLFAPFFNLLNQYQTVLSNHGSIAVATGHRTVARRLLDRLENVFSRDLSPDGCSCVICERSGEPHRGLGWGEVLERVSGRIEIPTWPPFDFGNLGHKAAELIDIPDRPPSPVKVDPDIAEELRGHYLRQNKKTRASVSQWMTECAQAPAPPPQEIDDETLTFAILTNLGQEERPYFNALLTGSRDPQPAVRAPTPLRKGRQDFVVKSGLSIQRLYRLTTAPRDAEAILYLVKNHHMHDLLHTISDINPSEWEILTSGRFDGFLWSGADDDILTPTGEVPSARATPASGSFPFPPRGSTMSPALGRAYSQSRGSRTTTPFSGVFSRGTTPASVAGGSPRQAVSHDEETEAAALAELEREIFMGMEALEDAFESLHHQAEVVREALRQRGAGLAMSLQHRHGAGAGIDVLPQSGGIGEFPADEDSMASESEWGGDDFDLAPEDSASNISSSRTRRPKRRNERRTPAPIEEEEE